jgi:hypothetical protein
MSSSLTDFARTLAAVALLAVAAFAQEDSQRSPAVVESSVGANYAAADVVFLGILQNLVEVPLGYKAEFKVQTPIKNAKASNVVVFSARDGRCGHFEDLKAYLVYAQNIGGQLWADLCSGTIHRSLAEADLQYIHTLNPKVSPECGPVRIEKMSKRSETIVVAEVLGATENTFFSCWSGLARCVQNERYRVKQVLKGRVSEGEIVVEHVIVDNSLTADVDVLQLSPLLFHLGSEVVLFLGPSASAPYGDARQRANDGVGFADVDEDCGALPADAGTVQLVQSAIH